MPETIRFHATEEEISAGYQLGLWAQAHRKKKLPGLHEEADVEELLSKYNYETHSVTDLPGVPELFFYVPEGSLGAADIEEMSKQAVQLSEYIGTQPDIALPIHTIALPNSGYMDLSGLCEKNGTGILLRLDRHWRCNWPHELIHALLSQIYGKAVSDLLAEGAATRLAYEIMPEPANHYSKFSGYNDILKVALKPDTVPLSHTQMLDGKVFPENEAPDVYERAYTYGFGGVFVEFLIERFGKQKFFEVYARNCWTDSPYYAVPEREIVAYALREANLDPYQVAKDFQNYLREQQSFSSRFDRFMELFR